jgi:hypothetical protein
MQGKAHAFTLKKEMLTVNGHADDQGSKTLTHTISFHQIPPTFVHIL